MEANIMDGERGQYLTFFVGKEEYAIGILRVKEIIEHGVITSVRGTPPFVRGVINLRGSVVPVIDLAVKFGIGATEVTNRTCNIIVEVELEGEKTVMGVMADAVSQVMDMTRQDIEEPPPFGTKVRVDYLLGMGKAGKKFILILDIDKVLSTSELVVVSAIRPEDVGAPIQPTEVAAGPA